MGSQFTKVNATYIMGHCVYSTSTTLTLYIIRLYVHSSGSGLFCIKRKVYCTGLISFILYIRICTLPNRSLFISGTLCSGDLSLHQDGTYTSPKRHTSSPNDDIFLQTFYFVAFVHRLYGLRCISTLCVYSDFQTA